VLLPFLRPEPLSRGMVEALARGRALVATRRGGPLDGVEEGVNGAFFEPTPDDLARVLRELVGADLGAMGRRSRAMYDDRFDARRVVAAHLDAYRWLVDEAGGARG